MSLVVDNLRRKVIIEYQGKDNYLCITQLHRKTEDEIWMIKETRISPEVQAKIVELVLAKQKEIAENMIKHEPSI